MLYYIFGLVSFPFIYFGLYFKLHRGISTLAYCLQGIFLILFMGCAGNDVLLRYLPWLDRLINDPSLYNYWGDSEVLVGLLASYASFLAPGLDGCFYLTALRLTGIIGLPCLLSLFISSSTLPRYIFSTFSTCLVTVPFVLGISNTILQGFCLVALVFFLCSYQSYISSGPKLSRRTACSMLLLLLSSMALIFSHSSGIVAFIFVLVSIKLRPFLQPRLIGLSAFSLNKLSVSKSLTLFLLPLLLISWLSLSAGTDFITSKREDSGSLFYLLINLASYVLLVRSSIVHKVVADDDYLSFIVILNTLLILFQGLLLPFGTPSQRIGMYFSVSMVASCYFPLFSSRIKNYFPNHGKRPLLSPLVPFLLFFVAFPFLPSFSNIAH